MLFILVELALIDTVVHLSVTEALCTLVLNLQAARKSIPKMGGVKSAT